MSAYEAEFRELQSLIASKEGDFKKEFKITTARSLTIYDVLNSPRVESHLQLRKQTCDPLEPGALNSKVAERRISVAIDIARSKDVQNKDYAFSGVAVQALTAAKRVLTDSARFSSYTRWVEQQNRSRNSDGTKPHKKQKRKREPTEAPPAAEPQRGADQPSEPPWWVDLAKNFIERTVAARSSAAAAPAPVVPQVNVSGAWGSTDGMRYEFAQFGMNVRMVVRNPFGIAFTEGEGTLVGGRLQVAFRAMTPMGMTQGGADAQVSPDGRSILGHWQNYTLGLQGPINLYR